MVQVAVTVELHLIVQLYVSVEIPLCSCCICFVKQRVVICYVSFVMFVVVQVELVLRHYWR